MSAEGLLRTDAPGDLMQTWNPHAGSLYRNTRRGIQLHVRRILAFELRRNYHCFAGAQRCASVNRVGLPHQKREQGRGDQTWKRNLPE